MTPTCPHCQRPIQSRAAKLCVFCGKAIDISNPVAAQVVEAKMQAAAERLREPAAIEPDADVIEIITRRGRLNKVDVMYGDKEAAAIAWGAAMTDYYSPAKAQAAVECDCLARRRAAFILRCQWQTNDGEQRGFSWLTLFGALAGHLVLREQREAHVFETFHAQCDTCAHRSRANRRRWALSLLAAIVLPISAVVAFVYMRVTEVPSEIEAYTVGTLFAGSVIAAVLAYRGRLTTGPGAHASGRCRIQKLDIVPKK